MNKLKLLLIPCLIVAGAVLLTMSDVYVPVAGLPGTVVTTSNVTSNRVTKILRMSSAEFAALSETNPATLYIVY